MPNTSVRPNYKQFLAKSILEDIQFKNKSLYYCIGKPEKWNNDDVLPSTSFTFSQQEDFDIRSNIIYMRKMLPDDVSIVVKRYNWVSGTVYSIYDHTVDLRNQAFYVLVDNSRVYKCLDNNKNSVSTVKPSGNSMQPIRTSDGYLWKYMYTIPSFKQNKFLTTNYMPVQRAMSDTFYNRGAVNSVSIINGGSGYTSNQLTTITAIGTTTGNGATISITVNSSGQVASVSVTNGGSGYTKGCQIVVNSSTGTGAKLTPIISGAGVVTGVSITEPGTGYVVGDSASVVVGSALLLPVVSRVTGSITDVVIINAGSGYTRTVNLTVNAPGYTVDGLYSANNTAILEAVVDSGSIQRVLIKDPGINYPSQTGTNITVVGDGSGLQVSPFVYNGKISRIIVESPGSNYSYATFTVTGSGTGAELNPVISQSDYTSDQGVVEQSAVPGAIHAVKHVLNGTGYNPTTTTVSLLGDGSNASLSAVFSGTTITGFTVNSIGSGYTHATIVVTDTSRNNTLGTFTDVVAYPIISPLNGHGYDAIAELFGDSVLAVTEIRSDNTMTKVQQDYRQISLISSPMQFDSTQNATTTSTFNVFAVQLNTTSNLVIDEILTSNNTIKYRVVYIDGNTAYLQALNMKTSNPTGVLVSETNSNRTYAAVSVISKPKINKFSGDLLYVSNNDVFEFNQEQGLTIKTRLVF